MESADLRQRNDLTGFRVARLRAGRAQHVVNLFVWPSKRIGDEPLQRLSRRGYSAYCWAKDGMHYWAVSDLNEAELQKFVELGRRQGRVSLIGRTRRR